MATRELNSDDQEVDHGVDEESEREDEGTEQEYEYEYDGQDVEKEQEVEEEQEEREFFDQEERRRNCLDGTGDNDIENGSGGDEDEISRKDRTKFETDEDDYGSEITCRICLEDDPPAQTLAEITALMAKFREIQNEVAALVSESRNNTRADGDATSTSTRQMEVSVQRQPQQAQQPQQVQPQREQHQTLSSIRNLVRGPMQAIGRFCRNIEPSTEWPDGNQTRGETTTHYNNRNNVQPPRSTSVQSGTRQQFAQVPTRSPMNFVPNLTPSNTNVEGRNTSSDENAEDMSDSENSAYDENVENQTERTGQLDYCPECNSSVAITVQGLHVYSREERQKPEIYDKLLNGDSKAWSSLIQLDCTCKDNMGICHRACAFRWYLSRADGTKCEICGSPVFSEASWENVVFLNLVQMAVNDRSNRPVAFRLPGSVNNGNQPVDAVALAMQQIRNARYAQSDISLCYGKMLSNISSNFH